MYRKQTGKTALTETIISSLHHRNTTYDGYMDLVAGSERRLTGHGDEGVQGQVLDYIEGPELTTDLLHCHTLQRVKKFELFYFCHMFSQYGFIIHCNKEYIHIYPSVVYKDINCWDIQKITGFFLWCMSWWGWQDSLLPWRPCWRWRWCWHSCPVCDTFLVVAPCG